MRAFGVDFGTTNSALALATAANAPPELARYPRADGTETETFRSILYFARDEDSRQIIETAGPGAIDAYLGADEPGRLMQSLKSFLAARDFASTSVLGQSYRLEALISVILRELRTGAERSLGALDGPVVVGRPVEFANQREDKDAEFALTRLRAAFRNAGFGDVIFEYEPVAAAYHYERGLDHDERILIADFGGGTSDFCLLRVGPDAARDRAGSILGTAGVGLAGDAFDGAIVRRVVAPLLGMGSEYRSVFGPVLRVPRWIYRHLERWHHISFLRSPRTLHILYDLCREGIEPERFRALLHVVENDLGFELYRAVESTKVDLSSAAETDFRFAHGPVDVAETIYRGDFASWIFEIVDAIAVSVEHLLESVDLAPEAVDRVFMTGGSSRVPAVREWFERRFGPEKIRGGDELTSVASGLALRSLELSRAT